MSSTQSSSGAATATPRTAAVPMRLEVVVVPVADVDRAKSFHQGLAWRLDADVPGEDDTEGRAAGADPQGRSYASCASFSDPDGNGRLLQQITERLPGRV